jgi:hypothetical protein
MKTEQHENRKKYKTTHRCIVGKVRVTTVGQQKPTTVKCYGIVKQFYVHFMYKPKRSTYKLTAAKFIGTSVTFWPSNPFDASHFDEDGQILDKDCPAYDFSGDSVFDVITMHEDIKL